MRYIDADKFLKDETKRCGSVPCIGTCTMDNESLVYRLAKAPTADVVEVKYGKWIKHKPNPEAMRKIHELGIGKPMSINSIFWTCSECGTWGTPRMKYCNECGAKMDGKEHR